MIKRIIRWEVNGTQYARGFIFGNYGWSFTDYAALVKEAKRDFPRLFDDDIIVNRVTKSADMKGFKAISFRLEPAESHSNYEIWDRQDFELA